MLRRVAAKVHVGLDFASVVLISTRYVNMRMCSFPVAMAVCCKQNTPTGFNRIHPKLCHSLENRRDRFI